MTLVIVKRFQFLKLFEMTFYGSCFGFGSKKLEKNGSGSVSVPEGRFRFGSSSKKLKKIGSGSVSVPKGRFRFGFRFHFFWNRRTLSLSHKKKHSTFIL